MVQANSDFSITEVHRAHQDLMEAERARVAGNLDQAQRHCEALLERHPDYFAAHSTLGSIFMQGGNYASALPHFIKAAMLNAKDWETLTGLGKVQMELDANELAIRTLNQSLKLAPDETKTLYLLGLALIAQQDHDLAVDHLERAQELDSQNALIPIRLCECCLFQQQYSDAVAALKRALELSPSRMNNAYIYRLASNLPKEVEFDLDLLAAIDALGEPQPGDDDVTFAYMEFARASCLDRLGRHKETWDCLVAANAPLAKRYEELAQAHAEQVDEFVSKCLNWSLSKKSAKNEDEKFPLSLFIIGASRAGKTTMERLVGASPRVKMLQEHNLASSTARHVAQRAGLLTTSHLCELPGELDPIIAETYRERLLKCADDADVITITHPGALPDAGRLVDCAPNIKFVFMKRHEDDLAFRIFGRHYEENTNPNAYDLSTIYNHLSRQNALIDNWLEKLGKQAMLVNYEDMVADPKATLARVAKFSGLKLPAKLDPQVGDDRGCAGPYAKWMKQAR
jgi:tetratricopeptide (TPR) repeat protein